MMSGVTLYHGCARIMRRGQQLPEGARITADPAIALADSWAAAEAAGAGQIPLVYEVVEGLAVDAVFTSPEDTWRAVLMSAGGT
jgi:hypothetical protein